MSDVPNNVTVGKNCVIFGKTRLADYKDSHLHSGQSLVKPINSSGVRA